MKRLFIALIISAAMFFWGSRVGFAQEEVPQFAGVPVFPNVFFIFDNSDSMNEVPYKNQYGAAYQVSWWRWKYAIKLDQYGNPLYSGEGFQRYTNPERASDPNPNSYLSGGNHPESKMFQAKLALRQVLSEIDNVNMGFATYLQERRPRVRALYYKVEPEVPADTTTTTRPDQWIVKYRRWTDTVYATYRETFSANRFSWCGTHDDYPGYTFPCNRTTGGGCPFPRTYEVYTIEPGHGADGSKYWHKFRATYHGYVYTYRYWNADTYPNCPGDVPHSIGSNTILDTSVANSCQPCRFYAGTTRTIVRTGRPAYYRFSWMNTNGSWSKNSSQGGYIYPDTLQVKPSSTKGTWQLLEADLINVLAGPYGTTANAYPTQFDYSYFRYPADGSANKPNAWSYVATPRDDLFLSQRNWQTDNRRTPYFPDDQTVDDYLGDPNELDNYSGDDNIFFVHLPDPDYGDDTAMANRDKIMSFLSLDRATYPVYDCRVTAQRFCKTGVTWPYYQFTMMPFTDSIPVNQYVAATPCGTPLGASLDEAGLYYESYFDQDSQTQIGCRENYVIVLTDGEETCGGDPVSAAERLLNLTWTTGPPENQVIDTPVKTYVIGFGLDPAAAASLNDIAAAGGTDHAYFATSLTELISTLTNIFQTITEGSYTRSDPVISREGDSIYSAYFDYPGWTGHVKKYLIDENGNVTGRDSTWYDDPRVPPNDVLEGDAGARLNDQPAAARTIWTATTDWTGTYPPPARTGFDDTDAAALHPLLNPGDFNEDSSTNQTDSVELINYIRDVGYNGGAYAWATRDTAWKLGDIYHSTPVVVTPPLFDLGFLDYDGFRQDHSGRNTLVLVGANDGMLHAFNDADGVEDWAYIPKSVLGNLKNLKSSHTYFVDLPVKAADIWSPGGSSTVFPTASQDKEGWRTVVIGGLRRGGNCYFALDITDTTADYPKPLWEITDPNMGETWSTPTFGRVKIDEGGNVVDKYVAFVAGGISPDNNVGNTLYVINIEEGNFLKKFTSVGGPSEYIPSAVRAVDLDRNGYTERLYVANNNGKLYKVDLTSEDISDWQAVELFDPGDPNAFNQASILPVGASLPTGAADRRRPVFFPPAVIRDRYGEQHYFILYGTGNELDPQNQNTQDFFFEIEDLDDGTAQCNWVYCFCSQENPCMVGSPPVRLTGEKCLSRPVAFNYVVYFTTYTPTQVCGAGQGFIYGLTISRGATTGGEGALRYNLAGEELESPAEHTEIGEIAGIPSSPVVTNGMIYFNSSNNTNVSQLRIPVLTGKLRSWQEVF